MFVTFLETSRKAGEKSVRHQTLSFFLRNGAWLFTLRILREDATPLWAWGVFAGSLFFLFLARSSGKRVWVPLLLLVLCWAPLVAQFAFQMGGRSPSSITRWNLWEKFGASDVVWGSNASWERPDFQGLALLPFSLPSRLQAKPLPQGSELGRPQLLLLLMVLLQAGGLRQGRRGSWELLFPCGLAFFLPWGLSVDRLVFQENPSSENAQPPQTWEVEVHSGAGNWEPLAGDLLPGPGCPSLARNEAAIPKVLGGIWGVVRPFDRPLEDRPQPIVWLEIPTLGPIREGGEVSDGTASSLLRLWAHGEGIISGNGVRWELGSDGSLYRLALP